MLVTTSDVDSSGEATVTAQSVEGEDDLVDVSMQDTIQGDDTASQQCAEKYVATVFTPLAQALTRIKISRPAQEIQRQASRLDQA